MNRRRLSPRLVPSCNGSCQHSTFLMSCVYDSDSAVRPRHNRRRIKASIIFHSRIGFFALTSQTFCGAAMPRGGFKSDTSGREKAAGEEREGLGQGGPHRTVLPPSCQESLPMTGCPLQSHVVAKGLNVPSIPFASSSSTVTEREEAVRQLCHNSSPVQGRHD